MKYFKTVILGAGLSGLSAGFFAESGSMANNDFIILEKENHPGGLCKSFNINNFIFDYTGHLFHYSDSFSKKFFQKILQKNINCLQRKAFIKIFNNFIPYPFQLNLSYLPSENNFKCLYSFIRSFYSNSVSNKNYLEWMNTYFGGEICKHFMIPYNKKLWKTDLSKITTDWFSNYMPMPKMEEVLKGAISKKNSFKGYNHKFYYPQKNGIGSLINYLFEKNKNKILLNYKIKHIDIQKKIIISTDQKNKYENLI
ncbi:NAD(P)-binding protein, partial [Candidatus Dependentiae bacterium]|nr:NAD(P)-binding protein [Candidatus Dependentiae bacterium]